MKLCFIDIETTGLEPEKNSIMEIGAIMEIDGKVGETFQYNAKPFDDDEPDQNALDTNGVSMETLYSYPSQRRMYRAFTSWLEKFVNKFNKKDKFYFLAYKAEFDEQFIRNMFTKLGDKYFGSWFWVPSIDVMSLAMNTLKGEVREEMTNFKLETVAHVLGVDTSKEAFHSAMYDADIAKQVYYKLEIVNSVT